MNTIWIDGDNCPSLVIKFTADFCLKHNLNLKIAANRKIEISESSYEMIICPKEKDSADSCILENADIHDIVITKDIIFAEKLLNKDILTINDRGKRFENNKMKYRMQDRDLDLQLAQLGFGGKKGSSYSTKELQKFQECLEKTYTTLLSRNNP